MNRRQTRAVEYYGYALIVGLSIAEARRKTPGQIRDYYKIRFEYDARVNGLMGGGKTAKKGGKPRGRK